MRISGWFLGLIGFMLLIATTGICSVVTYAGTRDVVVDLWDSGIQVESIGEVAQGVLNPAALAPELTPTSPADTVIVIASQTPVPTIVPTQAVADPNTQATQIELTPEVTEALVQAVAEAPEAAFDDTYRWEDPRQIRILLMGIDERVGFDTDRAYRTDTMIVVNVDPVRKTAGVISFPRDLWVNIPNQSGAGAQSRINTANYTGDLISYPGGGGPQLARETIQANFGIRVDYYLMVNFNVFEAVVNIIAPNGVEVCVQEEIFDPTYPDAGYGTIVVEFQPGCQRLDGTRLLQYARTRKTSGGDFDRAARQQETLNALRREVLSLGGVQNFFAQIGSLWNELSGSYRTDLTLDQIIRLGVLMGEIPEENIRFAVIDENYIVPDETADGTQKILLPVYSRINDLIQRIFYPEIDVTTADLQARAEAENAAIRVFNGTDIAGLAGRTQEWLIGRGVTIADVGNDTDHGSRPTVIRNYSGGRDTALWLADVLGLPPERIEPGTDGLAADGVIIVVGPDIQEILGSN